VPLPCDPDLLKRPGLHFPTQAEQFIAALAPWVPDLTVAPILALVVTVEADDQRVSVDWALESNVFHGTRHWASTGDMALQRGLVQALQRVIALPPVMQTVTVTLEAPGRILWTATSLALQPSGQRP